MENMIKILGEEICLIKKNSLIQEVKYIFWFVYKMYVTMKYKFQLVFVKNKSMFSISIIVILND